MHFKPYFYLGLTLTLYDQYIFVNTKALVGVNVRQVSEREFPYVVALVMTNPQDPLDTQRFCAGTLVSSRDVLTAEHCLEDLELSRIRILVGSDDTRLAIRYYVLWTVSYFEWATFRDEHIEFSTNDMGIIRLSLRVPSDVAPVALTTMRNRDLYGLQVQIAGWGRTNTNDIPTIMETVSVDVLSNRECERRTIRLENNFLKFEERLICTAAEPYGLLSSGDSGDPIIYNNTIVGVSSGTCLFQHLEFHPDRMNVHFGIEYYKKFIEDVVSNFLN